MSMVNKFVDGTAVDSQFYNNGYVPTPTDAGTTYTKYVTYSDRTSISQKINSNEYSQINSQSGHYTLSSYLQGTITVKNKNADNINIVYSDKVSTINFKSFVSSNRNVELFLENNSIKTDTTENNYTLTTTQINTLRENVATWLHPDGLESVQQIIDSGNTTNINNLIAQYQQTDWQSSVQ